MKEIISEIQTINKMKQVEISHFENKIFSIDHQIHKFRTNNQKVIFRYE